jgi:hypothetical protein
MCDLTARISDIIAEITVVIPEVKSISQSLPYRELDPMTGNLVTTGFWFEITTDSDVEFGVSVTEVNAVAAGAADAVADDAYKIKASIIKDLCNGLVFILQEHSASHTMVDPHTHTITCAGSQFCLRVTSPMPN